MSVDPQLLEPLERDGARAHGRISDQHAAAGDPLDHHEVPVTALAQQYDCRSLSCCSRSTGCSKPSARILASRGNASCRASRSLPCGSSPGPPFEHLRRLRARSRARRNGYVSSVTTAAEPQLKSNCWRTVVVRKRASLTLTTRAVNPPSCGPRTSTAAACAAAAIRRHHQRRHQRR